MTAHEDLQRALGSYVLGALDPAERHAVDEHLASCESCREQLASYAVVPGLLSRLSLPEAMGGTLLAPPSLLPAVLSAVERARQVRDRQVLRWRIASAALAVAASAAAALVLTTQATRNVPAVDAGDVRALAAATGSPAHGDVAFQRRLWGTEIHLHLKDLPAADAYVLYAVDSAGTRSVVARWGRTPSGAAEVPGAAAVPPEAIANVVIATTGGTELLTLHP